MDQGWRHLGRRKSSRFIISGVASQSGEGRTKSHGSEHPTTSAHGTFDSLVIFSLSGRKSETREICQSRTFGCKTESERSPMFCLLLLNSHRSHLEPWNTIASVVVGIWGVASCHLKTKWVWISSVLGPIISGAPRCNPARRKTCFLSAEEVSARRYLRALEQARNIVLSVIDLLPPLVAKAD